MIELAHSVYKDFSNGFTFERTLADVKSATPQLADTNMLVPQRTTTTNVAQRHFRGCRRICPLVLVKEAQ